MDRKKLRAFRANIPKDYQMDLESLVTSTYSAPYAKREGRNTNARTVLNEDKRSQAASVCSRPSNSVTI